MNKTFLASLVLVAFVATAAVAQPPNISQTVGVCDPVYPKRCAKPDVNGALPVTGSITASNPSVGTTGATAPASATEMGGKDASGNLQAARTDSFGGFIGGTATGTPTRTTLTASASTALPGAALTARPSYLRLTVETALTSNLFLCLNNQTCSATVYDELIPSGATAGTRLFEEIPFAAAVTYFTTTTPTVNATRLAN